MCVHHHTYLPLPEYMCVRVQYVGECVCVWCVMPSAPADALSVLHEHSRAFLAPEKRRTAPGACVCLFVCAMIGVVPAHHARVRV